MACCVRCKSSDATEQCYICWGLLCDLCSEKQRPAHRCQQCRWSDLEDDDVIVQAMPSHEPPKLAPKYRKLAARTNSSALTSNNSRSKRKGNSAKTTRRSRRSRARHAYLRRTTRQQSYQPCTDGPWLLQVRACSIYTADPQNNRQIAQVQDSARLFKRNGSKRHCVFHSIMLGHYFSFSSL